MTKKNGAAPFTAVPSRSTLLKWTSAIEKEEKKSFEKDHASLVRRHMFVFGDHYKVYSSFRYW